MLPKSLFTLPAGHLAIKHNRQHIILWMTALTALACVALAVVSISQAPTLWVYVCLFAAGTARTFLWPASSSFLPQLVSRNLFPRAVAWSSGSFQLPSFAVVYAVNGAAISVSFAGLGFGWSLLALRNAWSIKFCADETRCHSTDHKSSFCGRPARPARG